MSQSTKLMEDAANNLHEIPLWVVIVLALASGVSGEMWRVSQERELCWPEILKRIGLRFGASTLFGLATFFLAMAAGENMLLAAGACIIVGTMGADIASGIYERFAARKLSGK